MMLLSEINVTAQAAYKSLLMCGILYWPYIQVFCVYWEAVDLKRAESLCSLLNMKIIVLIV